MSAPIPRKGRLAAPVTHKHKCYVFVCVGCDLLADSSRSDAITCSTACRVRYHRNRNGRRDTLQAIAQVWDASVAGIAQANAISRLSPEVCEAVSAGRLTVKQAQVHIWPLYIAEVWRAVDGDAPDAAP